MRLELTHRFAVPLRDGFDYIVDPRNWPEYWPGLIRVRHERGFSAVGDGFEYCLAVEFEPRSGLRGAYDRGLVRHAVRRAIHRAVANLEGRL